MIDYKQFIRPIYTKEWQSTKSSIFEGNIVDNILGNGFIINNYFITAAHVISKAGNNTFIKIGAAEIPLSKEKMVFYKEVPIDGADDTIPEKDKEDVFNDKSTTDIAIFRIDGLTSPLMLADKVPCGGDSMKSYFYKREKWFEADAIVGEEWFYGNFFGCTFGSIRPNVGCSGSPLIKDNIVYGILHGGNEDCHGVCLYANSAHVNNFLSLKG